MQVPSPYKALQFLMTQKAAPDVVFHCIQVSMKAKELAERLQRSGHEVDVNLCTVGGLLHDLGRVITHSIHHAVEGAELIRRQGWPEELALIAERHVGGGIPRAEAVVFELPDRDYIPMSLEEKVVCYADKLFIYSYDAQDRILGWREAKNCSEEAKKLRKRLGGGQLAPKRLLDLERELRELLKEK